MRPQVSFGVQAHPSRSGMAELLAAELLAEVVYDPDPYAAIVSPWRTFRHLLETTPGEATHRLQIQDDALPCRHFREAALAAVEAKPDRLIVFYVGGNPHDHAEAVREACARDDCWVTLGYSYVCPLVCTCWPVGLIEPLVDFVDAQQWPPQYVADDEIVSRFLTDAGVFPVATVPSLVQHPDVVWSITGRQPWGGEDPGRVAACWIGDCDDCMDAREIDWAS